MVTTIIFYLNPGLGSLACGKKEFLFPSHRLASLVESLLVEALIKSLSSPYLVRSLSFSGCRLQPDEFSPRDIAHRQLYPAKPLAGVHFGSEGSLLRLGAGNISEAAGGFESLG